MVKGFLWSKVSAIKWQLALLSVAEGGVGVKDPICMIDSVRIMMLRDMRMKNSQPWVRWMERREKMMKERWGVKDVFKEGTMRGRKNDVKSECLFENAVKIWHEQIGRAHV